MPFSVVVVVVVVVVVIIVDLHISSMILSLSLSLSLCFFEGSHSHLSGDSVEFLRSPPHISPLPLSPHAPQRSHAA